MPRKKPDQRRAQRAKGRANRPRPWIVAPTPIEKLEQIVVRDVSLNSVPVSPPDSEAGESWAA